MSIGDLQGSSLPSSSTMADTPCDRPGCKALRADYDAMLAHAMCYRDLSVAFRTEYDELMQEFERGEEDAPTSGQQWEDLVTDYNALSVSLLT